ncbi:RNase H family protein [Thermopirellula anaerolimosa]
MIGFNLPGQVPNSEALDHFLLITQTGVGGDPHRWRFILRTPDGCDEMTAEDVEPDSVGERLELLTLVRGLEALNQPSHVTILTTNRYIREGLLRGLPEWRENGWEWECFQHRVPVKNGDLWKRVDRALQFHTVDCRILRLDPPHRSPGRKSLPGPCSPSGRRSVGRRTLEGGALKPVPSRLGTDGVGTALLAAVRDGVSLLQELVLPLFTSYPAQRETTANDAVQGRKPPATKVRWA